MTYIKWKDEVESYLGSVPEAERQKIFSYFSEMYADKRDAGKSEAQIIEEFGAPYDVAKRILADNRENSTPSSESGAGGTSGVNGGNNYNYNYYNYNYGGAPTPPPAAAPQPEKSEYEQPQESPDPFAQGLDMSGAATAQKPKNDPGKRAAEIILTLLFVAASIVLTFACVSVIVSGAITVGAALGAIAAANGEVGLLVATVGYGLVEIGIGLLITAGVSALIRFVSKKLKAFKEKK